MAKRKKAFLKNFLIISGCLAALQIGIIFYHSGGEKSASIVDVMNKSIAESQIPPERRSQIKVQIALNDYRSKHQKYPESLEKLVPEYFDSVPIDPETAEAFSYQLDGERYYLGTQKENGASGSGDGKGNGGQTQLVGDKTLSKEQQEAIMASLNEDPLKPKKAYDPTGKRDPFRSFDFSPKDAGEVGDSPLEQYSYDDLKLTAVLEGGDTPKAMVETPKGKGVSVSVGMKIGNLGGTIVKIEPNKLVILEETVEFTGEKKTRTIDMFLR